MRYKDYKKYKHKFGTKRWIKRYLLKRTCKRRGNLEK